ncbi:hypothetical protein NDU88_004173 [Pleurodeles waltl]|uniref:Uncharacterized protein n=1 Tax=Pleurodeles waltl TaxID=8319 RepID=A0AAV7LKI0_PLEWA|nr:hypothetical protein NDU88_004173 [Pleurodeles waltl]
MSPSPHSCSTSELLPLSSESVDRKDRNDGNQGGKNEYLSESSLIFLDYMLPDILCSVAPTKNEMESSEPPDAWLVSDGSLAEAAFDFKFANNSSSPSGGFCLTDSVYQHLSSCLHQSTNPASTESPKEFIISEDMIALKNVLASILALLEKFRGGSEHIEQLLTMILQALVPGGRTDGVNQDISYQPPWYATHSQSNYPQPTRSTVQTQTVDLTTAQPRSLPRVGGPLAVASSRDGSTYGSKEGTGHFR